MEITRLQRREVWTGKAEVTLTWRTYILSVVDPLVQMRLSPPVLDDLVHVGAGVEEEVVPPLLEGDVEAVVVVEPCHKLLGLLSSDVDPEVVERNFDLCGGDPATLVRVHLGEHEMELPFMPEQWWLVKFWDY